MDFNTIQPFIYTEENKAYTNNGSILLGFKLDLPEIYSLGEKDFEKMQSIWNAAFKNLPNGTIVHKMDMYLKNKFDVEELPNKTYLQKSTRKHFKNKEFFNHHSYLFFTLPELKLMRPEVMRNPFKKPIKTKEAIEDIEKREFPFFSEIGRSVDFLNGTRKVKVESLSKEELDFLEFFYFNGFYTDRLNDFDLKNFEIGEKKIGVFAITDSKQFGETISTSVLDQDITGANDFEYHQGFMDSISLKLKCEHIYNQIIFIKDHAEEKSKIKDAQNKLYGSRKFDKEYENDAEKLDEYLDEIAKDEQIRLVGGHFNIIYYAESDHEKKSIQEQITKALKNNDILVYSPSKDNQKNLISNSFPGFVSNIDRDNIIEPIDLQQLTCLISNISNYKNDTQGILFNDRLFNVPLRKDIWDEKKKRIKARNFFIMAPTGEGKSVTALHLFRQLYEENVIHVIFDLGNSYRKLAYLYPDDTAYLRYEEGKGLGVNPFALEKGEKVSSGKIEELANFTYKLWKREQLPTDQEAVALKKLLDAYYKNINANHSFPDFYDFIEENQNELVIKLELKEFFNVKEFLLTTSEFVRDGIYAFLFSNTSENRIDDLKNKKFIVFELDEVKDNPVLLSIMLHLGSEVIRKVIWSNRSKRGVIFFDEFAKMLKFPSVLSSTEYYYQTIRKYNGAVGIILQTPAQLPDNEAAQAIVENTQVIYILPNEKGYDPIINRFKLSSHSDNQLRSMTNKFSGKIKYSELGLVLGGELNIVRIELSKEALIAYSSDGVEYEETMELYNQYGDMEIAIDKYLENEKI